MVRMREREVKINVKVSAENLVSGYKKIKYRFIDVLIELLLLRETCIMSE